MRAIRVHWKSSNQLIVLALLARPAVNALSITLLAIIAVGKLMIEKGYARPYKGIGPKSNWCVDKKDK